MKTKTLSTLAAQLIAALWLPVACLAQVNSGSNGSDGSLDYSSLTNLGYSTNIVIDMHDHPSGIYNIHTSTFRKT